MLVFSNLVANILAAVMNVRAFQAAGVVWKSVRRGQLSGKL